MVKIFCCGKKNLSTQPQLGVPRWKERALGVLGVSPTEKSKNLPDSLLGKMRLVFLKNGEKKNIFLGGWWDFFKVFFCVFFFFFLGGGGGVGGKIRNFQDSKNNEMVAFS